MDPPNKVPHITYTIDDITTKLDQIAKKYINNINNELIKDLNIGKIKYHFWSDRDVKMIEPTYNSYDFCGHFIEVQQCRYTNNLIGEAILEKLNDNKNNVNIYLNFIKKYS